MKKKLLSLLMAVAMVLSLAVPVLASDIPGDGYWGWSSDTSKQNKNDQEVKFPAKMFVPTIKLTLPTLSTTDPVVLNPYRIEYVATASAPNFVNSGGTASGGTVSATNYNQQVICPVYAIKNETNAKLNVSASIATTVNGNLTLADNHVSLTETGNKALIKLIVKKVSVDSGELAKQAVSVGSALGYLDAYDTANNTVVTLAATNTVSQVAVMKNASLEPDGTGANYLLMQFDGELSRNPTTPWVANDKFTTTVTYTFKPVAIGDAVAKWTLNDAIASTDAPTAPNAIDLPTFSTTSGFETQGLDSGSFKTNPTVANWKLSLSATAVSWSVVDAGPLNVSVSAGKLSVDAAALKNLPKDNTAHDYMCVLGFNDVNGVPRTLELTISMKRSLPGVS